MWYAVDSKDRLAYGPYEIVEDAEAIIINHLDPNHCYVCREDELDLNIDIVEVE